MAKRKETERSDAYRILATVWDVIPYRSHQNVNGAMHSALKLAICHGAKFATGDFESFQKDFRMGYWWSDLESAYATACGVNGHRWINPNLSAAIALESHFDRSPYIWKWDVPAGNRLAVGSTFWWKGVAVKVTSMGSDSFIACSYKDRDRELKIDKRITIPRDEFTALQAAWSRYRRAGIFEVQHIKTWSAEPITDGIQDGESAWHGIFGEREHLEGVLLSRIAGDERLWAHDTSIEAARAIIAKRISRSDLSITRRLVPDLFETHLDVQVTAEDSMEAGNCPLGTRDWMRRNFPGRKSASIRELLPFTTQREVEMACVAAVHRVEGRAQVDVGAHVVGDM